ncbi:hypothetical protein PM082_007802 [Marasmius tenuissimus]|nr:hypothetical protein PM082_007802 [Marasmius tenuissimus]
MDDFAHHVGFGISFEPVNDSDWFENEQEPPPEIDGKPSTPTLDKVPEIEDLAPAHPTQGFVTCGTRKGPASFWSPVFLPLPSENSTKPVPMIDTLGADIN